MSNIIQEILFPNSGLNTDDANVYMGLGDSQYRLNILVGEDGSNGVITNSKGNRLATYPLINSNAYQVLGSYYNKLTRKCYYWVFSQPHDYTSSDDYIYDNNLLVFDEDTKVIQLVFHDTKNWFGLSLDYPIRDADMLGNYLYFNPRISEPKMIDVVRAWNYTYNVAWEGSPKTYLYGDKVRFFGGVFVANRAIGVDESPSKNPTYWDRTGNSYQDETDIEFDSEFEYAFNVIKHRPVYRPVVSFGSNIDKNANEVRGKFFRFTHRYQFFDYSYSVYGAYSDLTYAWYDEYYNGEIIGDVYYNNYIKVELPLHSAALVKKIEIVFQEINGDWKRCDVINRQDISLLAETTYVYDFYNNESYTVVDQDEVIKIEDSVPRWANTQELINKNILVYGQPTEGFSNIDKNLIDVTLTPTIQALSIPGIVDIIREDLVIDGYIGTPYWDYTELIYKTDIDIITWYGTSGIISTDILKITLTGFTNLYTITEGDVASINTFTLGVAEYIKIQYFNNYSIDSQGIITLDGSINFTEFIIYHEGAAEVTLIKERDFKTGAWHPFCVYYYDLAMRRFEPQTSKENIDGAGYTIEGTTVYVPMLNEYLPLPASTSYKWNIEWTINHLPPDNAKWWRWGYTGNTLCSYMIQYTITSISDETPWTVIDIAPLQLLKNPTEITWNAFPQSNIDPYAFTKGDRIRIITKKSTIGNDMGTLIDGVYDYEIVKYDDTTTVGEYNIYIQESFATLNALDIGEDSLIEIYSPTKFNTEQIGNNVFYEFGEIMPILEDSDGMKVHGVGTTGISNQVYSTDTPASGMFEAGDVYRILRTPSKPISTTNSYFHESKWFSDFYISDDWDKGKIGNESTFGQKTLNIIRYSNQYLQDTQIMGLSTFESDHYKELSNIYGAIMGTVEVGTTLKVYMEKKSASILIGRQEYMDANGSVTIATSDVVLGAVRYPENSFGTQWLESVIKNNRYVYGFDIYNAVMWRDSANGLFPISGRFENAEGGTGDYKMASWFKAKSDALMLSGIEHIKVITVWDERYKNLFITFKDKAVAANNETIVYHEPSNRWICFTNFSQTPAVGWNEMLELDYWILKGFENGIGYWFDDDTRFAVFDIPHTTFNVFAYAPLESLTFEALEPSVTCTADVAMDNISLVIQPLTVTVYISYVHVSVSYMFFLWTDEVDQQSTVVSCVPGVAYITNISDPSWIEITNQLGDILSDGLNGQVQNVVQNGDTLWFRPTISNNGPTRQTIVTITNTYYGDTATINISQQAAIYPPIVFVLKVDGDVMLLNTASGTLALGSRSIDLTFTPSGTIGIVRWRAEFNSAVVGYGTFTVTNDVVNNKTIDILVDVMSNEIVYVYLSSDVLNDNTAYAGLMELTFQALTPTVLVTCVTSSVTDMTWNPSEGGLGDMKPTTINTPTASVYIESMPSWISIESSGGLPFYNGLGACINDGDTIYIYPTIYNAAYELTGEIVLSNYYGNTATITVTHQTANIPPGESLVLTPVASNDGTGMVITPSSVNSYAVSGSNLIYLSFIVIHPWYGNSEAFTMYWNVYVNGVPYGSSTFVAYNDQENSVTLILSNNLLSADGVVINLSSMIF